MKRVFGMLIFLIILISTIASPVMATEIEPVPQINARSFLVMDVNTGIVLFDSNMTEKQFPASTTKIMTAILALENLNLEDTVTVSETAINSLSMGSSNIDLRIGENILVRDLLYGLLVASGGDAANVIAESVSGDIDSFVALMNQRAAELGAINTNFVNPHGLHDDNHYSSAYDLALFARYAMTNFPLFKSIVSTSAYILPPTNMHPQKRTIGTTNFLLTPNYMEELFYTYADGIKTGFTTPAKACLVSSATYKNHSIIAVVLGAEGEWDRSQAFVETKKLLRYTFLNYSGNEIIKSGQIVSEAKVKWAKRNSRLITASDATIDVMLPDDYTDDDIVCSVTLNEGLHAPIKQGTTVGSATYSFRGSSIGTVNIYAAQDVKASIILVFFGTIFNLLKKPLVLLFVVIVLFIFFNYRRRVREIKKEKRVNTRNYQ